MVKPSKKYVLLFLIFIFAFIYRMLLMHRQVYPPGADIGLHNSIIHSITSTGNTDFLWNFYQMGGGLSLTFPGYHIFVSAIIQMTGLPECLALSVVVSFFSSVIVLCTFLITRVTWGESTAIIAAFLVAVSRFDVEMLLWAGYPNAVTLLLIPLIFYLYLKRESFSLTSFLAVGTLLSSALFLTHSLSAVMFLGITFSTIIIGLVLSKRIGIPRMNLLIWMMPVFIGAIVVSPFLFEVVPAYAVANVETFTGGVAGIRQALLSTRILPIEFVIPLFASLVFFFPFSKKYKNQFLSVPVILFTLWILIPMLFTQGYAIGLYIDYNRFLYFVILPIIILIALAIDHGAGFFSKAIHTYLSLTRKTQEIKRETTESNSRILPRLSRNNIYAGFVIGFLLFSVLAVPIFLNPLEGIRIQSFYQVMSDSRYEAMEWSQLNTSPDSIFVSDALYGWWFSGFAQRPTISAVDPQYLTLAREFEPAKIAKGILDTDYIIDNGLIQLREDGGYVGRHNPMFLAKLNGTYFPYPFFHFSNYDNTIFLKNGDQVTSFDIIQLPVKEMRIENCSEQATIMIRRSNDLFSLTQTTTVYSGMRFANMSILIESTQTNISFLNFFAILRTKDYFDCIEKENTIGIFEEKTKVLGQMIFVKNQPIAKKFSSALELRYNLDGNRKAEIELFVGARGLLPEEQNREHFKTQESKEKFLNVLIDENLSSYLGNDENSAVALEVFDYQKALKEWNISYVACRDRELYPKFTNDPSFRLVFINDDVAIFMVRKNLIK